MYATSDLNLAAHDEIGGVAVMAFIENKLHRSKLELLVAQSLCFGLRIFFGDFWRRHESPYPCQARFTRPTWQEFCRNACVRVWQVCHLSRPLQSQPLQSGSSRGTT